MSCRMYFIAILELILEKWFSGSDLLLKEVADLTAATLSIIIEVQRVS